MENCSLLFVMEQLYQDPFCGQALFFEEFQLSVSYGLSAVPQRSQSVLVPTLKSDYRHPSSAGKLTPYSSILPAGPRYLQVN